MDSMMGSSPGRTVIVPNGELQVRRSLFGRGYPTLFLLISLLLLVTGCSQPEQVEIPELIPLADTPIVPPHLLGPTATGSANAATPLAGTPDAIAGTPLTSGGTPVVVGTIVAIASTPTLPVSPPPIGAGMGVLPGQIQLSRVPDLGLAEVEMRPPPYAVPLALHPDDHYWFKRPIPSGARTYQLEWYPYGNDVLLARLFPYRVHHGQDFPNPRGTPILAAAAGEVIWAGPLVNEQNGVNYYGNTVIVRHDWEWRGQPLYTLYAHTLELFVAVGDRVQQGDLLAGVGASGEVSGPHLHFEVRVGANTYGSTRNPALWVAPYTGWGTLAGRFEDRRGRPIHGSMISVTPLDVETDIEVQYQRTYAPFGIRSDEVWQENFAFGDLPAGTYEVEMEVGENLYRHTVEVLPGQTVFLPVKTHFNFNPTPIPTNTPTVTPTPTPTGSTTPTPTLRP